MTRPPESNHDPRREGMDLTPILLFGLPRSGTTWLGKTFDSHPHTLYRHEPDSGGALDGVVPLLADVGRAEEYHEAVRAFVSGLPANRSVRVTGKMPIFDKAYQPALASAMLRLLVLAAKAMPRPLAFTNLPEFIRGRDAAALRIVWKSIESLGRLGVIARALPQARAVQIVRHPCGYVASVLAGEAAGLLPGAVPSSEDYGILEPLLATAPAQRRGLTLEQVRSLHPVERLAWRWLLFNEKAMEDLDGLANGRLVRYESLCADPLIEYRELFDFAGLSWDPQTVAFIHDSTRNPKSSYFSVFKDPESVASGWRRKLPSTDQDRILAIVAGSRLGELYPA